MAMRIGYMAAQPGFPVAKQQAELEAAGVKSIYLNGHGAETLEAACKALRPGMALETYGGLRVLGNSRKEIIAARAIVKKMDRDILDIATGERTSFDGPEMLDRALSRIHHERTMPKPNQAADMGRKGGKARAKAVKAKAITKAEAKVIWFSREYQRDQDAAEAAGYGWGKSKMWKVFGSSGRPQGKRPTKR